MLAGSLSLAVLVLADSALSLSAHSPPDVYASPRFKIQVSAHDTVSPDNLPTIKSEHSLNEPRQHLMRTASGQAFLCTVPAAPEHSSNDSVTARPTVEDIDARRNARENGLKRGLALIEPLRSSCLYLRQGWFTYSFCYDSEVRQFHELHAAGATRPVEDPNAEAYVLGQAPSLVSAPPHPRYGSGSSSVARSPASTNTEDLSRALDASLGGGDLLGHGRENGMYLTQRWQGGTLCDKTGAPRSIEIQFHCNTETTDRIALVRETAICSYVMLIHTPRLCVEPLFLEARSNTHDPEHAIECKPVARPVRNTLSHQDKGAFSHDDVEQARATEAPTTSVTESLGQDEPSEHPAKDSVDGQPHENESESEEGPEDPEANSDTVTSTAEIEDGERELSSDGQDSSDEQGDEGDAEVVATIVYDPSTGEIVSAETEAVARRASPDDVSNQEASSNEDTTQDVASKALEEFVRKMQETIAEALRERHADPTALARSLDGRQRDTSAGQAQGRGQDAPPAQAQIKPGTFVFPPFGLRQAQLQKAKRQSWSGSENQRALVEALRRSYDTDNDHKEAKPNAAAPPSNDRTAPDAQSNKQKKRHDEP